MTGMVPPSAHAILTCQSPRWPQLLQAMGDPGGIGTMVCAVLLGCEELPFRWHGMHQPGFPG